MKALIVDDEPDIREELGEFVVSLGLEVALASNGEEALNKFFADPSINIVLSDLMMPGLNGLDMLDSMNHSPEGKDRVKQVIFMTGNGNTQSVIRAMHLGATEFLLKPVDLDLLEQNIATAQEHIASENFRRLNEQALAAKVQADQIAIHALNMDIKRAYGEALACLASAAEFKDPETGFHITRIGEYASALARHMGWSQERCEMIRLAAPLHDVGKVGMPDSILLKEGPLDQDELQVMRRHPEAGYKILSSSKYPVMVMAARISLCHHERWDGSGYPRQLKGSEVPVEASITSLVDVYDALRSERPYKAGFSHQRVMDIILKGDGRTLPEHFRPEVLEAFEQNANEMNDIFEKFRDANFQPDSQSPRVL